MPNTVRIKIFKTTAEVPTHDLVDVPWFAGLTVLQAMIIGEAMYQTSKFEFEVRYRSIHGAYIVSIDGLGDDADHGWRWTLYVNGAMSRYGVSETLVFESDDATSALVEWKYEKASRRSHAHLASDEKASPPASA